MGPLDKYQKYSKWRCF